MAEITKVQPHEIEKESFAIITRELGQHQLPQAQLPVIKRVIHTTADFDYAQNLYFSSDVVEESIEFLKMGVPIVTDTRMAFSGVNKGAAARLGCTVHCYMDDETVARAAKQQGTTRALAAVDTAARLHPGGCVWLVGNAPTALLRICQLADAGVIHPLLVVGVPVGFVNVVESKQRLIETGMPCIVAKGRKGGSNVAAAICNALMYEALGEHRQ